MPPSPTPEAWAQIRHEYENTRRSIEDICLAHGISSNTLRRRAKLWGWQMRQPPISDEGPPARAEPDFAAASTEPSPHTAEPSDTRPVHERLQDAVARVMQAIETTSARLTAGPVHLRETEMAARTLGSLTRTLGELNELLTQQKAKEPPRSVEELRASLARKLEAIIAERDEPPPDEAKPNSSVL
jgi:transposase-like protein